MLHATSDAEAVQLRNLGLGEKISVIPNGTEFPGAVFNKSTDRRSRRLLFLSRLHPVKGIDNLIRAWSLIAPKDWECVIAGPDEGGYLAELKRLHEELGSIDSIRFEDEVEGAVKWKTLSSADLFVLPSHSENFGIVVAEALACGVPVITTKCTPWRELESHSCGWWIEDNVEVLTETLKRALATSSSELSEMGKRGRSLVNRTYTWSSVAKQMKSVYSTILYKTQVSPSVFWGN